MIPTPAQIAAAQCNFVKEVIAYNDCKRFGVECCKTKVLDAFYLKKLAESGCDLLYDVICQLDSLDNTVADCTQDPTCEEMVIWSVKKIEVGGDYKATLENEYDFTNKFVFTPVDNSKELESSANVLITNGNGELLESYVVEGGCALVSGNQVCSSNYKSKLFVSAEVPFVLGFSNSYLDSIRLWNAAPFAGSAFGGNLQYQDVDISPANIWPARPGTVAVNPAHLYLDNPNVSAAIKNQIENFVYEMDGALNIDVSVYASQNGGITITTVNKHNPAGSWWGLRQPKWNSSSPYTYSAIRFFISSIGYKYPPSNVFSSILPTVVYDSHDFTNDCGQTSSIVVQGFTTPSINFLASDLNVTVLNSPVQFWGSKVYGQTINENLLTEDIPSCYKVTLIPTVVSTYPWSVSWYNPSGSYVGSGSITLTNAVKGNYKAVLTLIGTGCTLEKIINI